MSGLLSSIDGVASTEGRVLIMTTKYPEKLTTDPLWVFFVLSYPSLPFLLVLPRLTALTPYLT